MQEDLFLDTIFQQFVFKTITIVEWMEKYALKNNERAQKNRQIFKQAVENRKKRELEKIQRDTRYLKVGNETRQVFGDSEHFFRNSHPHF